MVNIFDGHEDKTPEELAKELGISDLSVIENAGREIIENLGNSKTQGNKSIFDIQTLTDTHVPTVWKSIEKKERLEVGKMVMTDEGNIGVITLINISDISCFTGISFFGNGEILTSVALSTFQGFKNNYQISINNIIDECIWQKPSNIGEIQKRMLVKFGPDSTSILGKIVFVSEESDNITVRNLSHDSIVNEYYTFEKFIEECSICVEKPDPETSDINDPNLRTNNCDFIDLEEGMKVKIFDDNSVGKITAIDKDNENILVWCEDGRKRNLNFSDIGTIFTLFTEDIENKNTSKIPRRNKKVWEDKLKKKIRLGQ